MCVLFLSLSLCSFGRTVAAVNMCTTIEKNTRVCVCVYFKCVHFFFSFLFFPFSVSFTVLQVLFFSQPFEKYGISFTCNFIYMGITAIVFNGVDKSEKRNLTVTRRFVCLFFFSSLFTFNRSHRMKDKHKMKPNKMFNWNNCTQKKKLREKKINKLRGQLSHTHTQNMNFTFTYSRNRLKCSSTEIIQVNWPNR